VGDEGGFAPNLASGTEDALDTQKKQLKMRVYFW
jgi:enolase